MAERISALASLPAHAGDGTRVRLSELRPAAILQIQAWPETLLAVQAMIAETLGIPEAPKPGRAAWFHGGSVAAIGAGRYLLSTTAEEIVARVDAAFPPEDAAVTDISHARTVLRLEGEAAPDLLSRCAPLDFDAKAFPADRVAQTAIHHIDVTIHRLTDTSFEIWALRSFAESLAEWILDAGLELGIGFDGPSA